MAVFWCALLGFLDHPREVFGDKLDSGRSCKDNREEFGFALVGHGFRSEHADNFARCYFECSLKERCQSVTFLWNVKECQMKKETKKSRPGDFVENPAATYMENNWRGLFLHCFYTTAGLDAFQLDISPYKQFQNLKRGGVGTPWAFVLK